jgi:glycosyltransferase involved in cell wall biosynthesis
VKPDISVLTPSYGYGHFIADAVESVLGQQPMAVEHVIQDGGSDDGTVGVLKRYGNRLAWASETDAGQSDALNRALVRATGRWIAWLNADEFYLPHALPTLMEHGEQAGVDVVYGDCVFVDRDGRIDRLLPQHRFSAKILREYGCFIPSNAVLIRRPILGDAPWDPTVKRIMDWDLYLKLLRRGAQFSHVAYPAGAFRVHDESLSSKPPNFEEKNEVSSRYGLPRDFWDRWRASRVGRWLHPVYKALGGAYIRELRARSLRGHDLRWFDDHRGRKTFEALLRRSYPLQRGRS